MAEVDDRAFKAMERSSASNQDLMLDFDQKLESQDLNMKDFRSLYLQSHKYKGSDDPRMQNEWLGRQESYSQMKSLFDPESYRQTWSERKDPDMISSMMSKAKGYMKEMRVGVEKDRFTKNYGPGAVEKWGVPGEVFEKKRGYEDWMREEGLFDETKTGGAKGLLQRLLPGGKKGYTRERIDPASERASFRGEGESLKKGSY